MLIRLVEARFDADATQRRDALHVSMLSLGCDGVHDVEAVERRRVIAGSDRCWAVVLPDAQDRVEIDHLLWNGQRVLVVEVPGGDKMHSLIKRESAENSTSSMCYREQAIESR